MSIRIKIGISTNRVDYSGDNPIPKHLEIRDFALRLHTFHKFEKQLNDCILLHKMASIKARTGVPF